MNFSRIRLGALLTALVAIAVPVAGLAQYGPPPAGVTPAPGASPTSLPRRGRRAPRPASSSTPAPGPSDTPVPPQFTKLDGTWEIEIQPPLHRLADYSFLTIVSNGANLTGYWVHGPKGIHSKMTGTFDGRLIEMTITEANGATATLSGYVENFDNMVGMYHTGDKDPGTAFTGEHRKKERT